MGCESDARTFYRFSGNSSVTLEPSAAVASGTAITLKLPGDYPSTAGCAWLHDLLGAGSWSQPLLTSSPVQFLRLGLGAAADGTIPLYVNSGIVGIGENVNANMTTGLHINQGAADDLAFCVASSDVAHGITAYAPTSAYGIMQKFSATAGGLKFYGFSEANMAMVILGMSVTDDTTKTTGGYAPFTFQAGKKAGANPWGTNVGTNANVLCICDWATSLWIIDKEGQVHMNETSTDTWPTIDMKQSSTGDVGIRYGLGSTISYMMGVDNSVAGDPLVWSTAASATAVLGTGDIMILTSAGSLGVGLGAGVAPATKLDIGAGAITLSEMAAPGAGAANTCRIYAVDNGAGKTQLMAVFASGAAQQIAIEP